LLAHIFPIPTEVSLEIIGAILLVTIVVSALHPDDKPGA